MSGIQNLDQLLGPEHPDIKYLKQDHISLVLSKALSETYLEQPNDPVQFFAKYLLNHVSQQKVAKEAVEKQKETEAKCAQHVQEQAAVQKAKVLKEREAQEVENNKKDFFDDLEKSDDLNDKLQHLCNFLQEHTKATGTYIGYLQFPELPIEDDAGDMDHLNQDAPKVVKFTHATPDHQYVVGAVLQPDQGITHDCFMEHSQADAGPADEGEGEEGEEAAAATTDILDTFKHVYVTEVVREPRMFYQRVPRLGSYMAVPLVYNHCLTDAALDQAVEDFVNVQAANDLIQKERAAWLEEYENRKQEAARVGEAFDEEEREFPLEEVKPFLSTEEKFVVCLDTMGQDREFTPEQRRFVLNTVDKYRKIWEAEQRDNLTRDRDERLSLVKGEASGEAEDREEGDRPEPLAELERHIEEVIAAREDEHLDEEQKDGLSKELRLNKIGETFSMNQEWQDDLKKLTNTRVLKMPKILQSLMYLLGFTKEVVCEPNSQSFFWKKAKEEFQDEVPARMSNYKVLGPKSGAFTLYQKLNYVEKLIAGLEQEQVDNHNATFGRLFKWLTLAIATRKQDIISRKAQNKKAREHRERMQEAAEERTKARADYLESAQEQFNQDHAADFEAYQTYMEEKAKKEADDYGSEDEEEEGEPKEPPVKPEFDPTEHQEKFDEENPEIEIPAEVPVEIDNDWDLTEEEELALIDQYWQAKE